VKRYEGITLIEMLLAFAIGAMILLFSMQQYGYLKNEASAEGLKSNLDSLFAAATNYYQANCGLTGNLSPTTSTPVIVDYGTDFINNGYMSSQIPKRNALVNSNAMGAGYVVQFNRYVTPCTALVCANPEAACTLTTTATMGFIVIWKILIGVQLVDLNTVSAYKNILGANCLTTMKSTGSMVPCTQATDFEKTCKTLRATPAGDPDYASNQSTADASGCLAKNSTSYSTIIAFERQPSFSSMNMNAYSAGAWLATPVTLQFTQQLITSAPTDLMSTPSSQFYYCGG
jgi:type II secretory pathway pseudopilin PulG